QRSTAWDPPYVDAPSRPARSRRPRVEHSPHPRATVTDEPFTEGATKCRRTRQRLLRYNSRPAACAGSRESEPLCMDVGARRRFPALFIALALAGCAALPKNTGRPLSHAIVDTRDTTLGRVIAPVAEQHPSQSGFLLYNTGQGAIQARVALAEV